jgi:hypothetical protein
MDTILDIKNKKNYDKIKKLITNPGKHLKDEKKRRMTLCDLHGGPDYIYDQTEDIYKKYKTSFDFFNRRPFKFKDCVLYKPTKTPDPEHRYYKNIYNKHQCDKVDGIWNDSAINRENIIDDGVCWIRKSDSHCGEKYQNKNLLEFGKNKKELELYTEEHVHEKYCNNDPICEWNPSKKDCISQESADFIADSIIPQLPSTWPKDITKFNIQNYLVKYYGKMLDAYPQRYMPVIGTGNRCSSTQSFRISQPQTVVNMIMKGMSTSSSNRGLLVWHSAGSGKTCTAAAVMESYWDTNKNIVFMSSIEALASNPPDTFIECAVRSFPRFKKNGDKTFKEQMDIAREEFNKRGIKFFSFAQLVHYAFIAKPLKVPKEKEEYHRNYLNNTILIIDEVQNIFKPLPTQKKEHNALREYLANYNNKYTKNLQIVILSATPGDNVQEVLDLLNMIRDKDSPIIRKPNFGNIEETRKFILSVKGLVSYFDISSDMSKYPKVIHKDPQILPMNLIQYRKYVDALNETTDEDKNYEKLQKEDKLDKYYKGARKYSNMLYNFEDEVSLYEFSSKLPALIENIKRYPNEKHFVYSSFFENRGFGGQGVIAIAKILEKELGYQKMTFKEARSLNKTDSLPNKRKRYALAITNELTTDTKGEKYTIGQNLKELTKLYNRSENKDGEYIHIFLASQKFNEGTDYKSISHVHIFEPLLTINKEIQTIARASRYCSHKDLSYPSAWTVTVHKYIADFPIETKEWNLDNMRLILSNFDKELEEKEKELEDIKGKKGVTELRNKLKDDISNIKKRIIEYKKELKEYELLDPKKIEMVDQKIVVEATEKMKDLLILNKILKETSIDCMLFKDFHAQSGQNYKCIGS